MSLITGSSNCIVYKCAFRYTDGSALEIYSGNNTIEDCYFYHIDYTATDLNGLMTTIQMGGSSNIFRMNTMHKMGASATLNPGNEALIELNNMYDSGYMQSDGSLIQCMVGQQPNVEIRYNWLHDTIKYGSRFDGNGAGNNGLMHHNVIWNVQGGIMIKGYEHMLYNNTAFDNGDKNDIIVMIEQGGNNATETRNNAANKIAGHRSGNYEDYPVPGVYDHNWNGYESNNDIKDMLVDPENFDFRPIQGSVLIDSGVIIENITGTHIGSAPDIGAYEYGGENWVPGISWDLETTFGTTFNEVQGLSNTNNQRPIPATYKLFPAFPNPFNPITTLRYNLPGNSIVNIVIYDMLGKQVKTLVDQAQEAGYRKVVWDATNDYGKLVSAGIYLYRIQVGEYISTKKMVLLK